MLWTFAICVVIAGYFLLPRKRTFIQRLPIPAGGHLIWGHEKTVFMLEPGRAFRHWVNVLGVTFRIRAAFGAPDILVLCDPEGIAHILQRKIFDYHHSEVVKPRVARLLGKGLGWVEGESEHKRMKRVVNPSLSSDSIKSMSQEVREASLRVLNDLTNIVQHEADGLEVNILEWASKTTLNVIGRVAFLHDFDGGNSEDAREIIDGRKRGSSAIAKHAGLITLMLLRRFPILNKLPISAIQGQGLAKSAIHVGVAKHMVQRDRSLVTDDQKGTQKDLLTRLLKAEAERSISREELFEQISTFIISGHETTTQTLGFTIWELSRHPNLQNRLRIEIQQFDKEPSYDDFQSRLPFLDAVLKETLRLYPGLPYMERVAIKSDTIPLRFPVRLFSGEVTRSVHVQAGQTVLIPIIAIHRSDAIWENPDEFRPDRWLSELPSTEVLCSGWSNLLAFSDGPRSCIGRRLAIFQYKVILTSLITRFSFEDTGVDISLKIASSLQPWVSGKESEGPQLPVHIRII